jgi:hypothetical protein
MAEAATGFTGASRMMSPLFSEEMVGSLIE